MAPVGEKRATNIDCDAAEAGGEHVAGGVERECGGAGAPGELVGVPAKRAETKPFMP